MKKINNKILILIIAIILIAGVAIAVIKGFNFDLKYEEAKKVELYLQKQFEISDIKKITDEVIPNQKVLIQKVEVFEDTVSIITPNITDEQKSNLINKINEKYGTELSADSTQILTVPHTRGRDIIKPYIAPFLIATIIILIYMAIRYYKLGIINTILKTIFTLILVQAVVLSITAITRIPFGRLTIPIIIMAYILTLICLTTKFEKKIVEKNNQEIA